MYSAPLVIGGLWLAGFFVRLFRGRAEKRDAVPLTFLLTNLLYIKLFAEGSAVHLYRVSFFSCFFAFAAADVTERTARFFEGRGRSAPRALLLGLAPYLLYQAFELPHAYRKGGLSVPLQLLHARAREGIVRLSIHTD